jgi:hypothetical protein
MARPLALAGVLLCLSLQAPGAAAAPSAEARCGVAKLRAAERQLVAKL